MYKKLKKIGPGAVIAAAFIGPGTVTTATIAGSSYGYTLLWAVIFSVFATYILQEMSARLGVIGGIGVGQAIRKKITNKSLRIVASVLIIGAVFIGNAAYEAGNITGAVLGFNDWFDQWSLNPLILVIGLVAFMLLYSGKYLFIERFLIALVAIMGLVFIIACFVVQPDFIQILQGMFVPSIPEGALLMVIGLIGTTVVPYNLFLHASSVQEHWSGKKDLHISRLDTLLSVVLGGIITMAILITAAVTFEEINQAVTTKNLSEGLTPIFGNFSALFLGIGFFAAGISSAITAPLAAAFATSEILGWDKQLKGKKFRIVWMSVLFFGLFFSCLGFKPTLVILFAQVANGILLPIIAIFLLWIMNDKSIMGKYINSTLVNILGLIIIGITLMLGLKQILSASGLL
ncbi:MAG: Nramp family divalent metal transporter [Saprospiraceae bacterium]|nr:Nramp family divalent metal transporter [Saprospiraceae bacterium]